MASSEQVIVPVQESVPRDRLSGLANEILLEICSHMLTWSDHLNLSKASRRYYKPLLRQLYKESDWHPLYIAVQTGNIATLDRCHEFGAPLDSPLKDMKWDLEFGAPLDNPFKDMEPVHYPGTRPLILAIRHYQPDAVEWLLAHGADPSDPDIMPDAPSLWMVLSPLQIARELPLTTIPGEEEYDSDDSISDTSDSDDSISYMYDPPPSLFRGVTVSEVVAKSEIIAALERAGSRDYPWELMIGSREAE